MKNNSALIFFFLSPVLGIIEAFKNLKSCQARQALFLFCLCFGFCFCVGTQRIEGSADGISMRMEFEQNKGMSDVEFGNYISDYFDFDTGAQDIYIVTMSYLVGKITDNYHFFFLALAFVFTFFQLKCLKYFVKEENYSNSLICIILTCLFLWNNIYNINGARFWTASWISVYCVFKIFHDQKPQYFLLALCLPMIHASYLVFPIILLLALFLQKYKKSLIILFCFSWVFSIIATDFNVQLPQWIELPFAISRKFDFYTSEEYIDSLGKGTGFYWVSQFFKTVSRHFIEILILLISLHDKNVQNPKNLSIVRFMLILAIIANFGMIVPTFGGRIFVVNYALVAYSFLVTFGDSKYKELIYLLPFVWFMNLFYLFKDVTAVLDFGFVLPPIISFIRYLFI